MVRWEIQGVPRTLMGQLAWSRQCIYTQERPASKTKRKVKTNIRGRMDRQTYTHILELYIKKNPQILLTVVEKSFCTL